MNAREYVKLQVERTRGQLRAAAFIRMGKNSLVLEGKTLGSFLADLRAAGTKPLELLDASALAVAGEEPAVGDIVSRENAFMSNEGMLWRGTEIRFRTEEGLYVSPDQYNYLHTTPLGPLQLFAESETPMRDVKSTWRSMTRIAREARTDKAKEIFYLTVGELSWEMRGGKSERSRVKSPLFLMPIREETTGRGIYKLRLADTVLKQNSVLKREIFKQTAINLYEGCEEDITLDTLESVVAHVTETVRNYIGTSMRVEPNVFHVCILDSHDEGLCQAVEKNIDAIADAPLTRLLAGDTTELTPASATRRQTPIYPLAADESQRRVIARVLAGESVYATAPAGTGKSQTAVNIAANLAIQGKSVCIMSEKLAANEVFLDYTTRIGLDQYCLSVDSRMKTADIVRQIKSIAKVRRQYVHTWRARETVRRYAAALKEFERENTELYRTDSILRMSLYDLIAQAVAAPEMKKLEGLTAESGDFAALRISLIELSSSVFDTMTDEEFDAFFSRGESGDEELDAMLTHAMDDLRTRGIDLPCLIVENKLNRRDAIPHVIANLARRMAMQVIGERDLREIGSRRMKATYKSLAETYMHMQALYVSFMQQELSARIEESVLDSFVSVLEKMKVSKVTPQELFSAYGSEIISVCPIIITTPTAATNYIYGTGLDRFHTMIIDEASQMPTIAVLPYLDRTEQLVVFGDHMQLGITSTFMKKDVEVNADTVSDTAYVDRSVLQAAQGRLPNCSLNYHYRSGTELLIHVSNRTCYDGLLEVVPDIYTDRRDLPPALGLEVIRVEPPRDPRRGENESEAREITDRVLALRDEYPDKSIGIISFNEKQQELISDMLDDATGGFIDGDALWVRSLENAQGKEADFIFISIGHCRRKQDGTLHKGISEINRPGGENRLNVLFTRARCKNFIVMSFDYRELRGSENTGVRRLYDYIDFAVNGRLNEVTSSRLTNADHAVTRQIAEMVGGADPACSVVSRIGSENMAVDIAVRHATEARYVLGILMPARGQTPQEALTKISVLERAGWHLTFLSPIYFLVTPALLKKQLARDLASHVTYTDVKPAFFDTNTAPDTLFTARDLDVDTVLDTYVADTSAITEEEFLDMDFESLYEGAFSQEVLDRDTKSLNDRSKAGDTEAHLVLLMRLRERFIREGKYRTLLANANRLYAVQKERRACYFFAQLLRIGDMGNKKVIENLLLEAHEMGIGGV